MDHTRNCLCQVSLWNSVTVMTPLLPSLVMINSWKLSGPHSHQLHRPLPFFALRPLVMQALSAAWDLIITKFLFNAFNSFSNSRVTSPSQIGWSKSHLKVIIGTKELHTALFPHRTHWDHTQWCRFHTPLYGSLPCQLCISVKLRDRNRPVSVSFQLFIEVGQC